jgi:hypothetical protein
MLGAALSAGFFHHIGMERGEQLAMIATGGRCISMRTGQQTIPEGKFGVKRWRSPSSSTETACIKPSSSSTPIKTMPELLHRPHLAPALSQVGSLSPGQERMCYHLALAQRPLQLLFEIRRHRRQPTRDVIAEAACASEPL